MDVLRKEISRKLGCRTYWIDVDGIVNPVCRKASRDGRWALNKPEMKRACRGWMPTLSRCVKALAKGRAKAWRASDGQAHGVAHGTGGLWLNTQFTAVFVKVQSVNRTEFAPAL